MDEVEGPGVTRAGAWAHAVLLVCRCERLYERHLLQDSFNGGWFFFFHFACYKLIQGLHYDVAGMNGAGVLWLALPGGGKNKRLCAARSSITLLTEAGP